MLHNCKAAEQYCYCFCHSLMPTRSQRHAISGLPSAPKGQAENNANTNTPQHPKGTIPGATHATLQW